MEYAAVQGAEPRVREHRDLPGNAASPKVPADPAEQSRADAHLVPARAQVHAHRLHGRRRPDGGGRRGALPRHRERLDAGRNFVRREMGRVHNEISILVQGPALREEPPHALLRAIAEQRPVGTRPDAGDNRLGRGAQGHDHPVPSEPRHVLRPEDDAAPGGDDGPVTVSGRRDGLRLQPPKPLLAILREDPRHRPAVALLDDGIGIDERQAGRAAWRARGQPRSCPCP